MYLKSFSYLLPETLAQAVKLRHKYSGQSEVLAGGTDLIVNMNSKRESPQYVISLKKLEQELKFIKETDKNVEIGCLTTHDDLDKSLVMRDKYTALSESASVVGSPQIRHVGTIGGNICSALPSADTASPLIALEAEFTIISENGERVVSSEEFFTAPGKSVLKNEELLKSIKLPIAVKNSGSAYIKFGRRKALEIALVAVAAYVEYEQESGKCKEVRIVLTSSGPKPWRCMESEKCLRDNKVTKDIILAAAKQAAVEAKPRSSYRSTEEYRRHLIVPLCAEALEKAFERAGRAI